MAKRIATGIYEDEYRRDVRATVNGITHYTSFPLDTKLSTMKAWQEDERAAIRRANPVASKGTLAADIQTYLAKPSVKAMRSYRNVEYLLNWWSARLGHKRRHAITAKDVEAGLDALSGHKPSYVAQFRAALQTLWSKLDGRSRWCPAKDVDKPKVGKAPVRSIDPATLDKILCALPQPYSPTSARILVLAMTGIPPATQMRIRPEDVDLINGTVIVPPRIKGDGVEGRVLPLTALGVSAFRIWIAVGAQGKFNTSGTNNTFREACVKAGVPPTRQYSLRHSFITQAVKAHGPVGAMGLAMHSNIATTMHYANGSVDPLMQATVKAMDLVESSSSWAKDQQIH